MCCTSRASAPVRVAPEQTKPASAEENTRQRRHSLPIELKRLPDINARVEFPNDVLPGALCNKELDMLIGYLGRNKKTWRRALMLHEWLQTIHHTPDDRFCTTLMRICSQNGQPLKALQIYTWLRTSKASGGAGLTPTIYTYTVAMRAALDGNAMHTAMEIWEDVHRQGIVPDSYLRCAYMETCMKLGMLDTVMSIFRSMQAAADAGPPVHAYTVAMRAATACAQPVIALEVWEDLVARPDIRPTGHAYSAAISACAVACDAKRAQQLFDDMLSHRIRPDVVSCTALITALGTDKQWHRCESIIATMRTWGVTPNARTYTALISAYANAQQWRRALTLLQRMSSPDWRGPPPNAYTYSAVIKCLGENGQYEFAEMVFSELEAAECPDSARAQTRYRVAERVAEHPQGAFESSARSVSSMSVASESASLRGFQEAVLDGFSMHKSTSFTSLFSSETSDAAAPSAASVSSMSSGDSTPRSWSPLFGSIKVGSSQQRDGNIANDDAPSTSSPTAYSASEAQALQPIPRRRIKQPASSVLSASQAPEGPELQERPQWLSPVEITLRDVRQKHAERQKGQTRLEPPEADTLLQQLTLPGVPLPTHRRDSAVNEVVCGALMHAYERAGMWREAVAVLGRARLLGVEPNTIMFNTAISAAGRAGQVVIAQALFDGMQQRDAVTYESLIAAYGSVGDPVGAERTLKAMRADGHEPHDYAYVGLIAGHSIKGNLNTALAVYRRMLVDGVAPTVHVMNAMLVACESHGRYEKALELFLELKRSGIAPNKFSQEILAQVCEKQYSSIETQQAAAAAFSAAAAAVGTVLIRSGVI